MKDFKTSAIIEEKELFVKELKESRLKKNISLKNAAKETGINKHYLKAIEEGNFFLLPKGIYRKKFLKEYSLFLGLYKKQNETFFNEILNNQEKTNTNPFYRQTLKKIHFFTIPKFFKFLSIFFLIAACLLYLGFYLKKITSPPFLQIFNPNKDITINKDKILIQGKTDPEAEVSINGQIILKKTDGYFDKLFFLKQGINTINIAAKKKYSRPNNITRKIIVKNNID